MIISSVRAVNLGIQLDWHCLWSTDRRGGWSVLANRPGSATFHPPLLFPWVETIHTYNFIRHPGSHKTFNNYTGWLGRRRRARVQIAVATLSGNSLRQTVHAHCASVHQAAKLVAALLRVAGVTAGLAESNDSLPPGLRLTSPAGWLPRTGISSGTVRSVIEYELPFYRNKRKTKINHSKHSHNIRRNIGQRMTHKTVYLNSLCTDSYTSSGEVRHAQLLEIFISPEWIYPVAKQTENNKLTKT